MIAEISSKLASPSLKRNSFEEKLLEGIEIKQYTIKERNEITDKLIRKLFPNLQDKFPLLEKINNNNQIIFTITENSPCSYSIFYSVCLIGELRPRSNTINFIL